MTAIITILSLILFAAVACKKLNDDPISQLTGTWTGELTIKILEEGMYSKRADTAVIMRGHEEGTLIIKNFSLDTYAKALITQDGGYQYLPYCTGGTSAASVTTYSEYTGSGKLVNGELIESGIIVIQNNGHEVLGEWETRLKRK